MADFMFLLACLLAVCLFVAILFLAGWAVYDHVWIEWTA